MKQYSDNFNKRSRLFRTPEIKNPPATGIAASDLATLQQRLTGLLKIQNDYFPCFDWAFPPPLLSKLPAPASVAGLFSEKSIIPGRYSLYLHIPFCKTLCSFCYYPVIPGKGIQESGTYVDFLVREMAMYAGALKDSVCESIYIGGGTPTYLDESLLERIFEGIRRHFTIEAGAEISIEAAPGTLSLGKLRLLKQFGVNRLSYGIQTLDEQLLATMNREYSVKEAVRELEDAVEVIGNVNVDTMYGFDGEPEGALFETLATFHRLGVPSLSIYSLDKQRSTAKLSYEPPKDERYGHKINQFQRAERLLAEWGYEPMLQNVFAIPDKGSYRHQVRRWENLTLVSLGLAAQGYAPRTPYQNTASLNSWYHAIGEGRPPIATIEHLSVEMELCRELTSKLRFTQVHAGEMREKYGVDIHAVFEHLIKALTALGYLEHEGGAMRLSKQAAYYNNILPMLFAPDEFKEQLMGLPKEYIETFPVPHIVTKLGKTQSVPFHADSGTAEVVQFEERRRLSDRRKSARAWSDALERRRGTRRSSSPETPVA